VRATRGEILPPMVCRCRDAPAAPAQGTNDQSETLNGVCLSLLHKSEIKFGSIWRGNWITQADFTTDQDRIPTMLWWVHYRPGDKISNSTCTHVVVMCYVALNLVLYVGIGFGDVTCTTVLDLTSLLRWAPALSRVI
jgi:hypothetical protein